MYNLLYMDQCRFDYRPSSDLIRPILCRDYKKTDFFAVSILKYWAQEYEDKLAEIILAQVSKMNGTPKKRQRSDIVP